MNVAERDDTHSRARPDTSSPAPARQAASALRSSVRMAIDVRSTALTVLAVTAAIAFLWWAQAVFIPVFLAVLISHALEPVVGFLERQRCPRAAGTFLVLGTVMIALGSTYAAAISNDDDWVAEVIEAGETTGELAWRLPLHDEYKELTKGTVADLTNASAKRKAGTIYAASFLEEFVDDKPWVHLDIAGTAWDVGRAYVGKGPTGFGVRLLVELARERS